MLSCSNSVLSQHPEDDDAGLSTLVESIRERCCSQSKVRASWWLLYGRPRVWHWLYVVHRRMHVALQVMPTILAMSSEPQQQLVIQAVVVYALMVLIADATQ